MSAVCPSQCDQAEDGLSRTDSEMESYCREAGFINWFQTSAKNNVNIEEAARCLITKVTPVVMVTLAGSSLAAVSHWTKCMQLFCLVFIDIISYAVRYVICDHL